VIFSYLKHSIPPSLVGGLRQKIAIPFGTQQELSYRKQIARQLRTQFVKGISVTVKSRLRVTQGHGKRNHWVDHTRFTISRVI